MVVTEGLSDRESRVSGGLRALDMRRLQTLDRVAARASFSQAADELHFTQSAVSQQIASLERDLGVRLVNRNPVSLTAPGQMLRDRYASALAELAVAEAELESFRPRGGPQRAGTQRRTCAEIVHARSRLGGAREPAQPKADKLLLRVPPAVRPRARAPHQLGRMLGLSAVFMAMTFLVFAAYGVFAAAVRRHLIDRLPVVDRVRSWGEDSCTTCMVLRSRPDDQGRLWVPHDARSHRSIGSDEFSVPRSFDETDVESAGYKPDGDLRTSASTEGCARQPATERQRRFE